MMRIVGPVERLGDKILFLLGRVIVRTVRENSVQANPKYIRNLIAVFAISSVKTTPTTESWVKLENEKRAMYKTAV